MPTAGGDAPHAEINSPHPKFALFYDFIADGEEVSQQPDGSRSRCGSMSPGIFGVLRVQHCLLRARIKRVRTRFLLAITSFSSGETSAFGVPASWLLRIGLLRNCFEFLQSTILPVVDGGHPDSERFGGVFVAQIIANDQFDRGSLTCRQLGQRLVDALIVQDRTLVRSNADLAGWLLGSNSILILSEALFALPPPLHEVVCDLEEITHGNLHVFKILVFKQPNENILRDVLGKIGRDRSPGEAVHAAVELFEKMKNGSGAIGIRGHVETPVQALLTAVMAA